MNPSGIVKTVSVLSDRHSGESELEKALARAGSAEVLDFAECNRVLSQVGKNIRARGLVPGAPDLLMERALAEGRRAAAYNMLLLQAADGIFELAGRRGIELLPYKGLSFLNELNEGNELYEADERFMGDLDFIVREQQVAGIMEMMEEAGWARAEGRLPEGFELEYSGEIKYIGEMAGARVDVEFRWNMSPGPALEKTFPVSAETPWRLSRSVGSKRSLYPAGDLFLCIYHLVALHSFARLMWFLDIRYIVEEFRHEINWESMWTELSGAGIRRAAAGVFRFLEKYMDMPPVPGIEANATGKYDTIFIERLIVASLCGKPIKKSGILPGLVADRGLEYFTGYLFPGREYLEKRYPGVPVVLLPLHRIGKLAAGALGRYEKSGD